MEVSGRLELDNVNAILSRRGLDERGKVQRYIDSEVLRLSDPYVPFQSGGLKQSGILGTVPGSGKVVWNSPYARFLYYGKVMIGEQSGRTWAKSGERKVKINKDINYNGAPKRGAYWFERAKADHLDSIVKGAARIAGGKGR